MQRRELIPNALVALARVHVTRAFEVAYTLALFTLAAIAIATLYALARLGSSREDGL